MQEEKFSGLKAFLIPFLYVCVLWILFGIEKLTGTDLGSWGIIPRTLIGLGGIITSPFIHSDINHLASNSLPILVVGTGVFYFYKTIAYRVIWMVWLFTGIWVWMAARQSSHIGASGLVYGFVCFLFFSGLIRRDRRLLSISLLVTFLYGSLVWGILPVDQTISWESHLFGSAAGLFAAIYFRKQGPEKEKYSWELEEEQEKLPGEIENAEDNVIIHYDFKEKKSPEGFDNETKN